MATATANLKVRCPTCDKEMKQKCLFYHQCYVAPSAAEELSAWLGDSMHRTDVIRFLISLGYTPAVSHTYLVSYVSSKQQAAYMREFRYLTEKALNSNEHHQAQRFEALYATDSAFREDYKSRLLTHVDGVVHTTMSPGEFSRIPFDHPLPNAIIFITPDASADSDLYKALMLSISK